jgi:hypothetical protein
MHRMRFSTRPSLYLALALISLLGTSFAQAKTCQKPIYLTFDTGNMAVAETVAANIESATSQSYLLFGQ